MNATKTYIIILLTAALAVVTLERAHAKGPPVRVTESIPAEGVQGAPPVAVRLKGRGFGPGAVITYYVSATGEPAAEDKMVVGAVTYNEQTEELEYDLTIAADAVPGSYDIEVFYSSTRKGKGTTLFSVQSKDGTQPPDCSYDFEAWFADRASDGVYSDHWESYVAFGGTGMRLDTNGSMKLERKNDTRFVWIDFRANGACIYGTDQEPAGAVGFCYREKGIDMRIEHQVQEPQGLCSIEPPNGFMWQTVRISFLGGPDEEPRLQELDLNGNSDSTESDSFKLNYGCQGPRIDPDVSQAHAGDKVLITRVDEHTWIFEGWRACVTSQLGNIMADSKGTPIIVDMPFALCVVDVNAPEDRCLEYLGQLTE